MASEGVFDVGDRVRLEVTFTDSTGADSDPTEVTIRHRVEAAEPVAEVYNGGLGAVVRQAAGRYHLDLDLAAAGRWYWRAEGMETPQAAGERAFTVRASQFD